MSASVCFEKFSDRTIVRDHNDAFTKLHILWGIMSCPLVVTAISAHLVIHNFKVHVVKKGLRPLTNRK
jgi:hypothetical protein